MHEFLSTKQVCQLVGISLSSFYRYCKSGLIKPDFFTPGGHRRFSSSHIRQVFSISLNSSSLIVAYSRVSTHDQKNDILAQEIKLSEFAKNLPYFNQHNFLSISDLGSGLNYKKKGLKNLLSLIFNRRVHTLILNHKDRLLRFGSEIIFYLCDFLKIKVIIVEHVADKSFEETLSADVIELMTVFCAKLYGKRSHKNKLKLT